MLRWLLKQLRSLFGRAVISRPGLEDGSPPALTEATPEVAPRRSYPTVPLNRHAGEGRPPKLHWKPSHPSTITRFKAEVTCSHGHGVVLRDHTVEADGQVIPSVVCKEPGCDFHEMVCLVGWTSGRIPAQFERVDETT